MRTVLENGSSGKVPALTRTQELKHLNALRSCMGPTCPEIEYVRYETSSALRKAGAFLPKKILAMNLYKYRLSPYMSCSKRCRYCFEPHNEFVGKDQVKIKTNTVEVVRSLVDRLERDSFVLLDGYDCEAAEQREKLIRRSLEVLLEYRIPVMIQTKSDLVLRDLDLLEELHDSGISVNVSFSITDLNERHDRIFEPFTCSSADRIRAMKKISDKGISTGILMMPVLPFISDTVAMMDTLFARAAENGCGYIVHGLLRLTGSGPQREMWFDTLKEHYPQFLGEYERLYPYDPHGPRFGSRPREPWYLRMLSERVEEMARKYSMPTYIPEPRPGRGRTGSRYQNTLDRFL